MKSFTITYLIQTMLYQSKAHKLLLIIFITCTVFPGHKRTFRIVIVIHFISEKSLQMYHSNFFSSYCQLDNDFFCSQKENDYYHPAAPIFFVGHQHRIICGYISIFDYERKTLFLTSAYYQLTRAQTIPTHSSSYTQSPYYL